jgi:trk system potassium uptake protein TrkA
MKQIALIGLDIFARRVLDELEGIELDLLIIDKSKEVVESYRDRVRFAYVADAIDEEVIRRVIPGTLDTAVVDLGGRREASILVTNYLKKMGIPRIIAKAESDQHGEILQLVGATHVVFPNREAAKRVVPQIISSDVTSYLPLNADFVIAEVRPPARYVGQTLIEANLRVRHRINVVAFREAEGGAYHFFHPEHRIQEHETFLIAGKEADIASFASFAPTGRGGRRRGILRRLLGRFG